jgi:crotonobetainyl-CoA:carnitine CoA-transferase CaiB-like acyl-CoA transferase
MSLALAGVKVLDLTRALAGPFCTMTLADLGADVVKLEPMPTGEMSRQWGPRDKDVTVYFLSVNRNKKGIAVNLRQPEGLALVRRLALASDVVVENFKVGTMETMGLGYEELAREKPGIILASISGFGTRGPARSWAGFDQIAQGYSGIMSLNGTPESGPMRTGVAIGDLTSGMWLATAVLAALFERQRTGRGQHVQTSLLASLMSLLTFQGQRYLSLGQVPEATGNDHPVITPYGTFEASDGPMNLAPATPAMWVKLCSLLGLEALVEDPRFIGNAERTRNRAALKALIEDALSSRTRMEWTRIMLDNGIPAGPINDLADIFEDAQVEACNLVQSIPHPVVGDLKLVASPMTFSGHSPEESFRSAPPVFGQHTAQVLSDLGLSDDEVARLLDQGAVYQAADGSAAGRA